MQKSTKLRESVRKICNWQEEKETIKNHIKYKTILNTDIAKK